MPLPIVGAHFRPPAKPILEVLPAGCPLIIRREPDNQFDQNALMVLVRTDQIPEQCFPDLAAKLPAYGFELEQIHQMEEWHLGYVPKMLAATISPRMDEAEEREVDGRLSFDAKGKPEVRTSLGEE